MNRKPYMTSTHRHFKVKAKNLKKGDRVALLGYQATVKSVIPDSTGEIGLVLRQTNAPNKKLMLILPKNLKVTVTDHKFKSNPKNR